MKNLFFKGWKGANDILNAFIDDHFGIYMSLPTPDTAYLTILPEDKLAEYVPHEYAPMLNERARAFTTHLNKFIEKHKLLTDIPDDLPMEIKEQLIKSKCMAMLDSYEKVYKKTMLVSLKQFLGLRMNYDSPSVIRIIVQVGD